MAGASSTSGPGSSLSDLEHAWRNDRYDMTKQAKHGWSSEKHPDNIVLSDDCLTVSDTLTTLCHHKGNIYLPI